jgi:hypothetical protein
MYAGSADRPKIKVRRLRNLFVLRDRKDDGIVVHSICADDSKEARAAMTEKTDQARKTPRQTATLERGINFDVPGRAIIAQADERIEWHKRAAGRMEAELKAMPMQPGAPATNAEDWKQVSRRTDLQTKIDGHLEYARFLDFVRQNIVRDRRYRLGLADMSTLEIMPKGTYW